MRYTFGTDEIALQRLRTINEVFNPHSSRFIREHLRRPAGSVVDAGCGPGFTTHMLSMAARPHELYGLDTSEDFLLSARETFSHCVFLRHDVTRTPFPVKADALYSRFLLSHLQDPVGLVNRWSGEVNHGGILLIEELEGISTDVDVFARYLAVNRGLVASQGAALYVGGELAEGRYNARVLLNECVELPVRNCDAAAMFHPNTRSVWRTEEYVRSTLSPDERRDIASALSAIAASGDARSDITWKMRRLVLRNDEYDPYEALFI